MRPLAGCALDDGSRRPSRVRNENAPARAALPDSLRKGGAVVATVGRPPTPATKCQRGAPDEQRVVWQPRRYSAHSELAPEEWTRRDVAFVISRIFERRNQS